MKKRIKVKNRSLLKNPKKSLWTLAIPIMFGIGIQTFYNLIDLLFIGQIGGDAIAGVAFNMPIFFLMLGLTMGLGSGVTASIARFIGEKNKVSADNSAEHALAMAGLISFVSTLLGIFYGKQILMFLGAKSVILEQAWDYLSMIIIGLAIYGFLWILQIYLSRGRRYEISYDDSWIRYNFEYNFRSNIYFQVRAIWEYWARPWCKGSCISNRDIPIDCFYNFCIHVVCKKTCIHYV